MQKRYKNLIYLMHAHYELLSTTITTATTKQRIKMSISLLLIELRYRLLLLNVQFSVGTTDMAEHSSETKPLVYHTN